MMIITHRPMVHGFFGDTLGILPSADMRGILWVPDELSIPGTTMRIQQVAIGVGYNSFIGKTCAMHVVIQHPQYLTRKIIQTAFEYPFNQCGVNVILGLVDSSNKSADDFDRRIGFEEVYRVPDGGIDGDLIVLQMKKADCHWIKGVKYGRQKRTSTT